MTIADKLKQIKQSTDAIKASVTALTGEVQTDLTSIATELDKFNPANATDLLAKLGYDSNNAPDLYNALLSSLEERESYENDTAVLLPKLTLDENGVYQVNLNMFKNSTILTVPKGKYHSNFYFSDMFRNCTSLLWIPDVELSSPSNDYPCSHMFSGCTALRTVGNLNTKGCNSAFYMFEGCTNLESIASLDTGNVTTMGNMFDGCKKLKSIPQLDTSNVEKMANIFRDCSALTSVPQLDYSSVTDMNYGFSSCTGLTTIPDLNLESATSLNSLFYFCSNIVTIGNLNTPKLASLNNMFYSCNNLKKIESIDVQSVNNTASLAGYSNLPTLKYVVLKNLGQSNLSSWDFSRLTNWGVNSDTVPDAKQSLIDTLITYSYDRASAGMKACTVKLSSTTKALLTDDEITQIATKGYTIA